MIKGSGTGQPISDRVAILVQFHSKSDRLLMGREWYDDLFVECLLEHLSIFRWVFVIPHRRSPRSTATEGAFFPFGFSSAWALIRSPVRASMAERSSSREGSSPASIFRRRSFNCSAVGMIGYPFERVSIQVAYGVVKGLIANVLLLDSARDRIDYCDISTGLVPIITTRVGLDLTTADHEATEGSGENEG